MKIAITGMGIISAIGNTLEEHYFHLSNSISGLGHSQYLKTTHQSLLFGEVKKSNEHLIETLGLTETNFFSRTGLLGAYAAKKALENAGITDCAQYNTGFISATTVSGMDKTEELYYQFEDDKRTHPFINGHYTGDVTNKIAKYLGIKGLVTSVSTACSSAPNAIMMGANLIKTGRLDRVIVGGTDALSKFTINGFHSLMILTDEVNKPFDNQRKGLNLGEGAAYLVLESDKIVSKEHKQPIAYLSGYGNANDAYHQTASSENGEGAFLAMQKALKLSKLQPQDIHYINAHGTATPNNDLSEGRAIARIFGNDLPAISSTKPFTGHTLAAAGAIEAVFSILCLQNQVVFPNLNFQTPMDEVQIIPQTIFKSMNLQHVLSNSFGFGGNCSSLIISKA